MAGEIDISASTDLDPNLASVSGRTAIGQAVFRRLVQPRADRRKGEPGFPLDDEYGLGLTRYINTPVSGAATLARIARAVEAEALEDERVDSAAATVTVVDGVMRVDLTLTARLFGEFDLQIEVSEATTELLGIS